jgi:hypothetical protein
MKIRYVGQATIRIIERDDKRYVWAADVNYAQDVPADLAAELLTYPRPDFVVDAAEPLMALPGVGLRLVEVGPADPANLVPLGPEGIALLEAKQREVQAKLAGLALSGVGSIADLAALSKKDLPAVAEAAGVAVDQAEAWVAAARQHVGQEA